MRLGRDCLLLSAFILSVLALPADAARTAFRYDAAQRVIKACVLGIGAQTAATHPNPYLVEGLRRSELTPDDWVFENPLAPPTVVTGDTPTDYVVKGKRDYWFVPLTDESARRLVGMDLIYVCAPDLDLSYYQYEGLRAAVEAGAVLWVDNDVNAGGTVWTSFPWVFQFADPGAGVFARVPLDGRHGLLSEPHNLSLSSVARLGGDPDLAAYQAGATAVSGLYITNLESSFRTVVQVGEVDVDGQVINRQPFVVAAQYGSGSVVVTTGGVGLDVAEWIGPGSAATGFVAGRRPAPDVLQAPDVKLGLNMVQWNDRWEQARRTPRASASTVARAPLPLDIKWQFPEPGDDPAARRLNAVVSTPVHSRGMVYAISVPAPGDQAELVCLDADPRVSLNGDAFPDDGIADYGAGAGYDVVWRYTLPADFTPRFAGPALASVSMMGTGGYLVPVQVVLIAYVDPTASPNVGYVSCINATVDPEILAQVPAAGNAGDLLWTRPLTGFGGNADVVALSTPVVHNGFVYVLADEYDATLAGTAPERAYGRVHCFQLDFDWSTGSPDDAGWWVYPSSDPDLDGDGSGVAVEEQRSLPSFHDPVWVANPARPPLPPAPGSLPVVHAAGGTVDGGFPDALVTFGTAATFAWDAGLGRPVLDTTAGGSAWCVVPAPLRRADGAVLLNEAYFRVRVNQGMLDVPAPSTTLDINPAVPVATTWYGDRYCHYAPGTVREAIAAAAANGADPLQAQLGLDVLVDYERIAGGSVTDEHQQIPGPVRWRTALAVGQSIVQPPAVGLDDVVVSGGPPITYPPVAVPANSGGIARIGAAAGGVEWSYDPTPGLPFVWAPNTTASVTAPALAHDTAIVGTTSLQPNGMHSSIVGLSRPTEVRVRLGRAPFDPAHHLSLSEATPTLVTLLRSGDVLSPGSYRLDRWTRDLIFPSDSAGNVVSDAGVPLGPIYGQTIVVDFMGDGGTPDDVTDDTPWTEMHYVPALERFHHTPHFIQLRRRPVNVTAPLTMTRPDGTAINMATVTPASPTVNYLGVDLILDGWIDIFSAADVNGVPVVPGDELLVSYTGWSEEAGGFITVPNPVLNIPLERHVVAEDFGPSISSPVIAGEAIHLGTLGLDADHDEAYNVPRGRTEAATMLSLAWNRATGVVRSALMQPSVPQLGVPGIPVVMGAPSVGEDRVYVGTRMMDVPTSDNVQVGYVSALGPWRVLLTDAERVVETTGSEPSWVCTGTSAPQRGQSFVGEDVRRPFSRPAKATRLQTGNILVVDSGNNRVVEIDRAGRLIWPLDLFGFEYYTSPDNHDLSLSRPADAYRYYDTEAVDTDGNGTADRTFPVLHTIVADTGNARVIDIVTRFYDPVSFAPDGRQRHTVRRLTPTYVRVGTSPRGYERVRYTSAQPIFDPVNDALIGYLCAASNLNQVLVIEAGTQTVNPRASVYTPNGTAGARWRYWAWLYDADPSDANHVSNEPLQFENIKHVEYTRYGSRIYVTVTCTRYVGRAGAGPHALAARGPGVFEFIIDVSDANPDNWALDQMGAAATWPTDQPHWRYTAEDYHTSPMANIVTAAGTPQAHSYLKRWYPVCARRLRSGDHLVVNSLSMIESGTPDNIGAGARRAVLGSHIFQVATMLNAPEDPEDDTYTLDEERSVPQPGEIWADPFTQPTYAEVN